MPITSGPAHRICPPVKNHRKVAQETFLLAFDAPSLADAVKPGQFLMVSFPQHVDPLLPRPFAVFDVNQGCVEILYKRVGKGTHLLSHLKAGDRIQVLGPLGSGFTLSTSLAPSLVMAGGIGIASVHLLLHGLLKRGFSTTLLYGAGSREELIPLETLKNQNIDIHLATEDGGEGLTGNVCELFLHILDQDRDLADTLAGAYVCGPPAMLKSAAGLIASRGIKAQFSLESRMACGYGVCQGCVIQARDDTMNENIRYRKVCTDGPVFDPTDVDWDAFS